MARYFTNKEKLGLERKKETDNTFRNQNQFSTKIKDGRHKRKDWKYVREDKYPGRKPVPLNKLQHRRGEKMEMMARYFTNKEKLGLERKKETDNTFRNQNQFSTKIKDGRHKRKDWKYVGEDKYPGRKPVPLNKLKKYRRGEKMETTGIRTKFSKILMDKEEKKKEFCVEQSARAELLLPEESGFLEADKGEKTFEIQQHAIASSVDIISSTKYFDLKLHQFGPYVMDYSPEGRHLLLGGKRGHVATFDWVTKKLFCEMNVMESVHDVKWLHLPTMFAAAQKSWVYIYDNQGIELHCIKQLYRILRMEFLRYHFLLATSSEQSFLSWLDVSIGKMIAHFYTKKGQLNVLAQNPYNAVLLAGHSNGTVTMWSPNVNEPLVSMLCHNNPVRAIAVNKNGTYMATCGTDRSMKIWDIRNLKCLQSYRLGAAANSINFSQRDLIAVGIGNIVEVYKDCCKTTANTPYLRHSVDGTVMNVKFCPYEDVLGISHNYGFTSTIIPGAGEPNFDAWEANPMMTKKQRKEMEVKALLEKIQPEFIVLNPEELVKVNVKTLKDKLEERKKILYLKPQKIDFEPRKKKKGRSSSVKIFQKKKGMQQEEKRKFVKQVNAEKRNDKSQKEERTVPEKKDILDRFKSKYN